MFRRGSGWWLSYHMYDYSRTCRHWGHGSWIRRSSNDHELFCAAYLPCRCLLVYSGEPRFILTIFGLSHNVFFKSTIY